MAISEKKRLILALVLSCIFFSLELFGGLWSNSLALLSDSFHLLTDVISLVISLSALHLSTRKPCSKFNFGYARFEILGALTSILLIYACTIWLIVEAIHRLQNPEYLDGKIMFGIALSGVIFNCILIFTLHHHHHHHHHHQCGQHEPVINHDNHEECGHHHVNIQISDEDVEIDPSAENQNHGHRHSINNQKSVNIRAAVLHLIGDLLSSIGVLIASTFVLIDQTVSNITDGSSRFIIVDPICTFIFSAIVVGTTLPLLKECFFVLMEANDHLDRDLVIESIEAELSVKVLDFKSWLISIHDPYCIVVIQSPSSKPYIIEAQKIASSMNELSSTLATSRNQSKTRGFEKDEYNSSSSESSPETLATFKHKGRDRDLQPLIRKSKSRVSEITLIGKVSKDVEHSMTSLNGSFDYLNISLAIKDIVKEHGIPAENIYVVVSQ